MKITKYILIAASALAFNACDNYLDLTPKGKTVIETTEDYNGLIEMVTPLYDPSNFAYLPIEQVHYFPSQVLDYTIPVISASFLWDEEYDRANNFSSDPLYEQCYKRISKYNILLDGIDDSKGDDALKAKAKAQARILRAYNYFFLVNVYAPAYNAKTASSDRAIILRKEFNMESTPAQSTVQEVYDLIQEDIDAAIPGLTELRENVYRPGKAFGYAFKAKVHLFKGELKEALAAAKKATEYDGHLWNLEEYLQSKAANPMYMLPFDIPECLLFGYSSSMMNPMAHIDPELDALIDPADIRGTAFLAPSTIAPAYKMTRLPFDVKWNCSGMRYSEVYLIMAECYARLGEVQDAVDTINELRKARFAAASLVEVSASTPEEARQVVIDERRIELMLTANAFFDMKRYTVIPEYSKTLTRVFEGEEYTLEPDSHMYVLPFNFATCELNPNLVQNSK